MAHLYIEASVRTHRKFLNAGPAACWLWLCGVGYSQDGLTDGFIPDEAIGFLGVAPDVARELAAALVRARLWVVAEGGWQIHDYLEHNRSAASVAGIRASRAAGGHLGGRPRKTGKPSAKPSAKPSNIVTETVPETVPVKTLPKTSIENPPNPSQYSTEQYNSVQDSTHRAAETAAAPPLAAARAPIHDRSHRAHAHCGRVCLHATLFGEFVRRRNHPNADRELRDWALQVDREWSDGGPRGHVEPGEPFEFWRARYDERWPAVVADTRKKKHVPAWVTERLPETTP
jgi:hypothetical protein